MASDKLHLNLIPLTPSDIPDPESQEFSDFLDCHFAAGDKLASSMDGWDQNSLKVNGTVQIVGLKTSGSQDIRKKLAIKEYWCGRVSHHTAEEVDAQGGASTRPSPKAQKTGPVQFVRSVSRRMSSHGASQGEAKGNGNPTRRTQSSEVESQAAVMSTAPAGLYERFRRGLLEYHSEHEREYIEACRETQCLQVYQPHVAEVWRLTYVTPPPTSPRTFVVLLLSRELRSGPEGERCFINISIPFNHPDLPEKKGSEIAHVRGKYVSVERVQEQEEGRRVEWRMSTSSDAGGNIPRFMTNSSLPSSIAEDVPSFLKWLVHKHPGGGGVGSAPVSPVPN